MENFASLGIIEKVNYEKMTAIVRDIVRGGTIECCIPVSPFNDPLGNKTDHINVRVGTKCSYMFIKNISPSGHITNFFLDTTKMKLKSENANEDNIEIKSLYSSKTYDSSSKETRGIDGSYKFSFESGEFFFDRFNQYLKSVLKIAFFGIGGVVMKIKEGIYYFENTFKIGSAGIFSHKIVESDSEAGLVNEVFERETGVIKSFKITKDKKIITEIGVGNEFVFKNSFATLTLNDKTLTLEMQGSTVYVDKKMITMTHGDNKIVSDKNYIGVRNRDTGVFVTKKGKVTIQSEVDINLISAKNINMTADGNINIKAKGKLNASSSDAAKIVSGSSVSVHGSSANISDKSASLAPTKILNTLSAIRKFAAMIKPISASPGSPCAPDPMSIAKAGADSAADKTSNMTSPKDSMVENINVEKIS